MTNHLPNYLRAHRKGTSFSQRDVARLLGGGNGSKVSGYERFRRTPTLQTALKLQVIFDRPVAELFEGMYKKSELEVAAGAKQLAERPTRIELHQDSPRRRKLDALAQRLTQEKDVPF